MSTVSSLVVKRRLATMRQVEEALARQAVYGGDVVTNLLEVALPPATSEMELTRALADALEVGMAPLEAMRAPDAGAVAKIPRILAEQHGFVPVARDGDAIVVALAEPLGVATYESLVREVGAPLKLVASPQARLRQALERAYGVPMDGRSRRLVAQLDGGAVAGDAASVAPPPRATSIPEIHDDPLHRPKPAEVPEVSRPRSVPPPPGGAPMVHPSSPPPPVGSIGSMGPPSMPTNKIESVRPPPNLATTIRGSKPSGLKALAGFLRNAKRRPNKVATPEPPRASAVETRRATETPPPGRRRRGPFTREEAERTLVDATAADVVLSAVLEFAQQYFTYVALFVVHHDLAEGWDARGRGASGDRLRKMGVPLDMPSMFSRAHAQRIPIAQRRPKEGLDSVIAADLDRAVDGDVVVIPCVVGKRVVALLYGDDGTEPISVQEIADVVAVAATGGTALARIIVRRKKPGGDVPRLAMQRKASTPNLAIRAAALADALGSKKTKPDPDAPPASAPFPRAATPAPFPRSGSVPPESGAWAPMPVMRPVNTQPIGSGMDVSPIPAEQRKATDPYGIPAVSSAAFPPVSEPPPPVYPPQAFPEPEAHGRPPGKATLGRIALATMTQQPPLEASATPAPPDAPLPTPRPAELVNSQDVDEGWSETPYLAPPAPSPSAPAIGAVVETSADSGVTAPSLSAPGSSPNAPVETAAPVPMAPPPSFAKPRTLAPLIPREEPELHYTPSVDVRPSQHSTSEPELIEAAEVSDAELEELLSMPSRESERIEAYPPRPPPKVHEVSEALPKVIVALEPEHVLLVERAIKGGRAGETASDELRDLGAAALPAIMDRFPGPTRCDRTVLPAQLPRPAHAGPLLSLLVQLDHLALRDILARVGDPSAESRFWATYLLTEIVDLEAAPSLVPRLVDDDIAVRRVAVIAARALLLTTRKAASVLIEPLVTVLLDPGAGVPLRVRAATALGEMRDEAAVEGLIIALDEAREQEVSDACQEALVTVARHDPTRVGGTWQTWFAANESKSRIEWLIEGLMDDDLGIRESSAAELKELTKVYFGYYANLPRAEREQAYRRYRTWWNETGKKKYKRVT